MVRLLASVIGVAIPLAVVQAKTDRAAVAVARKWLRAVAKGDTETLLKSMSLPFTYATTAKIKTCERTVVAQKDVASWVTCVLKSEEILMELTRGGIFGEADAPSTVFKALDGLAARISRTGTWIEASIDGDGIHFTVRFLVVDGGVAAFLVDVEFDPG